jgi:hypothetical protein
VSFNLSNWPWVILVGGSNTLSQQQEVEPSTSPRSGSQGSYISPPCRLDCRTVVKNFNRSSFLFVISYLQMLLYILNFCWAETNMRTRRSTAIFQIYTRVNIFTTPHTIVCVRIGIPRRFCVRVGGSPCDGEWPHITCLFCNFTRFTPEKTVVVCFYKCRRCINVLARCSVMIVLALCMCSMQSVQWHPRG